MQIVVFKLGEEEYAIDTSKVQVINKMMDITTVPKAPAYIRGLINLRGSIVTVVDPYIKLGIDSKDKTCENIIILETEDEVIGILVDKVTEVIEIDTEELKNISSSKEDDRDYIKGTINLKGNIITLIDVDVLLDTK
jgi:purine-binding chemotaxis protein CheW